MSNPGRFILSAAGATLGFVVGGPVGASIGFQIGNAAGSYIFPTKLDPAYGPRLQDLQTTTVALGDPIPQTWGTITVPGTIIAVGPVEETSTEESVDVGKGESTTQTWTTYSYKQTVALGLCECSNGPIGGIFRIWENGDLKYDMRPQQDGESADDYSARVNQSGEYSEQFALYLGTSDQSPDPSLEALYGEGVVPAFRDLAYIVYPNRQLLDTQAYHHPAFKFEVWHGAPYREVDEPVYSDSTALMTSFQPDLAADLSCGYYVANFDLLGTEHDEGWRVMRIEDNVQANEMTYAQAIARMAPTYWPDRINFYGTAAIGCHFYVNHFSDLNHLRISAFTLPALEYAGAYDAPESFPYVWGKVGTFTLGSNDYICWSSLTGGNFIVMTGVPSLGLVTQTTLEYPGADKAEVCGGGEGQAFCVNVDTLGTGTSDPIRIYRAVIDPETGAGSVNEVTDFAVSSIDPTCSRVSALNSLAWDPYDDSLIIGLTINSSASGSASKRYYVKVNWSTGAVIWTQEASFAIVYSANHGQSRIRDTLYAVPYGTDDIRLINTVTGAYEDTEWSDLLNDSLHGEWIFDGSRKAIITQQTNIGPTVIWLAKPSPADVSIATIVRDVCARCGVDTTADAEIDVSDLEDRYVQGYALTRPGQGRGLIEPLRKVGYFDGVESDGKLKFPARGGVAVATLTADDLGARHTGDAHAPAVTTTKAQDAELPRQVRVHYLSESHNYDSAVQLSPTRITSAAISDLDVEVPVVIDDDHAARSADILWMDAWEGRWRHTLTVDLSFLKLDPADVIEAPIDGRVYRLRIVGIDETPAGLRRLECVRDYDGASTSYAVADDPQLIPASLAYTSETNLLLLDLPLLRDGDNDAGIYAAAWRTDPAKAWRGAAVFLSRDGGGTYASAGVKTVESIVGTLTGALSSGPSTIMDGLSVLTVSLPPEKALESVTVAALLEGSNAAAVGAHGRWEIVQYQHAVKIAENVWELSGLLRGRRGTEHAIGSSITGDYFVPLSESLVLRLELNVSDIGSVRHYKAVSIGQSAAGATHQTFAGAGEALRPFSPVHVTASCDIDSNVLLAWTRRGRIGQEMPSGADIALSEASEAYAVEIYSAGALVRTITATTASCTYTYEMQYADFGATTPASIDVYIYQISATAGRGHAVSVVLSA